MNDCQVSQRLLRITIVFCCSHNDARWQRFPNVWEIFELFLNYFQKNTAEKLENAKLRKGTRCRIWCEVARAPVLSHIKIGSPEVKTFAFEKGLETYLLSLSPHFSPRLNGQNAFSRKISRSKRLTPGLPSKGVFSAPLERLGEGTKLASYKMLLSSSLQTKFGILPLIHELRNGHIHAGLFIWRNRDFGASERAF